MKLKKSSFFKVYLVVTNVCSDSEFEFHLYELYWHRWKHWVCKEKLQKSHFVAESSKNKFFSEKIGENDKVG